MLKKSSFSGFGGDLAGGLSSGIVSIPGNIAFGMIAVAPLGAEYIGVGVLAGMFSSIVAGIFASLLGGAPGMISGPKMPTALVFGSLLGQLLAAGSFQLSETTHVMTVLTLAYAAIFLSGLLQLIFGILRLGTIVKFIPYPVIAGIQNSVAILILKGQFWSFIGVPKQGFSELLNQPGIIQGFTLIVALATTLFAWQVGKRVPKFLAPVLTIIAGTALYYLFDFIIPDIRLGPVIGSIPSAFPTPKYAMGFVTLLTGSTGVNLLSIIIPAALALAVLSSIDSLIALVSLQSLANRRLDGNRELIGQGVGNAAAAIFGGLPGSGFIGRTAVNYQSGGRTKLSGILSSITVLTLAFMLNGVIGIIPKCVMAGLLVIVACKIADKWSIQLGKDILFNFRKKGNNRELLWNASVILLVMIMAVTFNLIIAVAVGVVLSIFIFVVQMSRTPVRKEYNATYVHSRIQRHDSLMAVLTENGNSITVLELEGSIFFGSADNIANSVDKLVQQGAKYIIMDMKRVARIDSTGVKILQQTHARLKKNGIELAFSYVLQGSDLWDSFTHLGLLDAVGKKSFFQDTDWALGYFEDKLLATVPSGKVASDELSLHKLIGLDKLPLEQTAMIIDYIEKQVYEPGSTIIQQGKVLDAVYFIASGAANVTITLPGSNREKRLGMLTYGTFFGETALWDQGPSPVNVIALEPVSCYHISLDNFATLKKKEPAIAMAITHTISKRISQRLRQAIDMITEIES